MDNQAQAGAGPWHGIDGDAPVEDVLEVKGLSKTFKSKAGDITAVDDVSFEARKSEVTVIVGPSGSGKTRSYISWVRWGVPTRAR
ncbi:MAG: hypothetical protein SWK76_14300 [Actinomycetota bacterium]|nr:hypothetical protein [Actinomycetota bacterium]